MPPRISRPSAALAIIAMVGAVTLSGCAPADGAPVRAEPTAAASSAADPVTGLTLRNCGLTVEIDAPPERVVAIKSTAIEMLLALGLEDRIVGAAFIDGPFAEEWAERAAVLPVLSDKVPGAEAFLEAKPDFVYAGWESNVSAEGVGGREDLAALGIPSYIAPAACVDPQERPVKLSFDDIFAEIGELGQIFAVEEDAEELIAAQRDRLDRLTPDDRGLTAVWFSSGGDQPFVGAGIGAPQLMMETAGLENVFADIEETWTSVSWEAFADADPDVIVLVDAAWSAADDKIRRLEENPATAQLAAVREGRYLRVPFPTAEAGVRTVEAVEQLAGQLGELP